MHNILSLMCLGNIHDWALKGAHPVNINRWYKFGALVSIRTVAPGFREISELPDWVQTREKAVNLPWIPSWYHSRMEDESPRFGAMRNNHKGSPLHKEKPSWTTKVWSHEE
ncbi:hypothetical protein ACS0TY_014808 [Phlomoides rotata]